MSTIIVTGASQGIGKATALRFLEAGWTVGLLARRPEALAEVAKGHANAIPLVADVTDEASVETAFASFATKAGRLDAIFNNAGRGAPAQTIDEMDVALELTRPTRRARWFWNAKVRLALLQSRLILTVSEYSARDIAAVLGVARDRIRVAVEAPAGLYRPSESAEEIRAAVSPWGLSPGDEWFVYVGGFNPHKRVDAVVRAHAEVVRGRERPPHLLLVGDAGGDRFHGNVEEIRAAIRSSGTESLVHWTGFVDDATLRHVHSGAVALVLVSEAEGFGLPAVEAAACGTPVIATKESPLPEILEGGGIFVTPNDHTALVAAMRRLIEDPATRQAMGRKARERAEALTWERGAHAALGALREAAA
jgi:glycosyltransferase involved in cell wall biosynthesis